MKIAEVSEKYSLSVDTLRYYERVGLIPPVNRNDGGIQDYNELDLSLGLTLGKKSSYVEQQGISMSVPHVTGVVALMLSIKLDLTPAQIKTILTNTASPVFVQNNDFQGIGILNAAKAVQCARTLSGSTCSVAP